MAKITKEKYDLPTLAIKGKLIGSNVHFEEGVSPDIVDWYIDSATQEIHLQYSDGTGDSIASTVQASAIRIREETIVTYRCTFNSGTGASKVTLRFLPPVWTTITTGIQNLTCVANCTHERGDGAWESLINQGVSIESAPLSFALQLGREDNVNFPANKLFQLSARFSYTTNE